MGTQTPTSVYRYYDADGRLIYVGVTSRGMLRQNEHNAHAPWWRFVASQDVEHVDTREAALRRERALIERHHPPFNRQHNPDFERRNAEYLRAVDSMVESCGGSLHCQCWWAGVEEGSTSVQDALAALVGASGDPVVASAAEDVVAALAALVDTLRDRRNVYAGSVALAVPEQALIDEYTAGASA